MKAKTYECYPAWTAFVYYFFSFTVYLSGLYLLYLVFPLFALLFFIYIIYLEISVLREGCVRCYYYGKRCVCGKGAIAKRFFKKDEKKKFNEKKLTFKNFIPSMLPMVFTVIAGAYLVVVGLPQMNFIVIGIAVWPLLVMFLGNPFIYGRMACPHCKQMELGCPACEFFMKKDRKKGEKR